MEYSVELKSLIDLAMEGFARIAGKSHSPKRS